MYWAAGKGGYEVGMSELGPDSCWEGASKGAGEGRLQQRQSNGKGGPGLVFKTQKEGVGFGEVAASDTVGPWRPRWDLHIILNGKQNEYRILLCIMHTHISVHIIHGIIMPMALNHYTHV